MATPSTIAEYIAGFPRPVQTVLKRVRRIIREAVPEAKEGISYGIPAFILDGRRFLYFAGWKKHYSLYPISARLAAAFKRELAPYELSHKGTVRFPLDEPIPEPLIAAIAKFRVTESAATGASKTRVPKTRAAKTRTSTTRASKPRAKA